MSGVRVVDGLFGLQIPTTKVSDGSRETYNSSGRDTE